MSKLKPKAVKYPSPREMLNHEEDVENFLRAVWKLSKEHGLIITGVKVEDDELMYRVRPLDKSAGTRVLN